MPVQKQYLSAIALQVIPLVIGVVLLCLYKPAGYGIFIFAIIGAYLLTAIIFTLAIQRSRRKRSV